MPFKVKKSGKGYKVFSPNGAKSKKPISKEKAQAQQRAIYANWDGKESTMTPQKAKKLLETIKQLQEAMSVPGDEWDDEGNYIGGGGGDGYRRRRSYYSDKEYRRPTAAPLATPAATNPDEAWKKYLLSFRNKEWNRGKTDDQLKPIILAWLAKQQQPKPTTPPLGDTMLESEVKSELLETASMLLGIYKDLKESKKSKEEKKKEKELLKKGKHPDLGKNMEWYEKLAAKKAKKENK